MANFLISQSLFFSSVFHFPAQMIINSVYHNLPLHNVSPYLVINERFYRQILPGTFETAQAPS